MNEIQEEFNDPMCDPVFQPYYVAFAQAHYLQPDAIFKTNYVSAYIIWIQDQWLLWEKISGRQRNEPYAPRLFREYLRYKFFPEAETNINIEINDDVYWEVDIKLRSRVRIIRISHANYLACLNGVTAYASTNFEATEILFKKLFKAGLLNEN